MPSSDGPIFPPGVTQELVEVTLGPLISGVWLQQLLFGFTLAQFVDYYRAMYSGDSTFNKYVVNALLGLNIFIGGLDFHVLYRVTVLHFGVFEYFDLQEWTMWTEPGFTALVGLVAQLFFLHRAYKITTNKLIIIFLSLLVLFSLAAGLTVSGSFIRDKRFSKLGLFTTPIILWLVSTSVADVAIASVLIYQLMQSRTAFKMTNSLISRLILMSMETSAMTAIVATLNLVLFLPLMDTAYHLLPQFSMSRVYTLTVMATLLARADLRSTMMAATHQSIGTTLHAGSADTNGTLTGTCPIRVGVTKTIEDDRETNTDVDVMEMGVVRHDSREEGY